MTRAQVSSAAVLLSLLASLGRAAPAPDAVPETDAVLDQTHQTILTAESSGEEYLIQVSLPHSYGSGDARYPVVYVLDGNLFFGMATDVGRLLPLEGIPIFLGEQRVPEMIVVGIGYPGGIAELSQERGRDFNPPEGPAGEINPDGAANFRRFLQSEVIPWVDSKFRTVAGDRTLVGVSRGGVFALSSLFLHPETFPRVVAISPAIEPPVYDYLAAYAQRKDVPPTRLYLSAGSEGEVETELAAGVERLSDRLEALVPPQLRWTVRSFEGETHPSVVPRALVDGLITVFSEAR